MDVASSVITTVTESIATGTLNATSTSETMLADLKVIRDTNLTIVIAVSLILTLLFGYVVARIALGPTRNALASQKQFIGNIAHELRTPLSIVKANSEILLSQNGQDQEATEMIKSNIEELDRISGIINNLLTLNTFRHSSHMNFSSVDIGDVVRDALNKFEELATKKGIVLDADIEENLSVWGNKSALDQITMNLIKNAIVYTPKQGSVFVKAHILKDRVTIEIRDTGIGITRKELKRIFEPFYQVDPSRSQGKGSSGLGLAIVSELVKLHHGKISLRSTPKIGTTAIIELPSEHKEEFNTGDTDEEVERASMIALDFSKR